MSIAHELRLRRIKNEALRACERSPELHEEIRRRLESQAPIEGIELLLEQALRGSPTLTSMVAASTCALRYLEKMLSDEDRQRLEHVQASVLAHTVGPSLLKAEIYRLARQHQVNELLDSTWFDELFERSETRRLTDSDDAVTA